MITLNGKEFAECKKAITKTCVGYFKKYSRQIKIFNRYDKLIGVINKFGVLCCATKLDNGKYYYSFATINEIGEYQNYSQRFDDINKLAVKSKFVNNEREYWFK